MICRDVPKSCGDSQLFGLRSYQNGLEVIPNMTLMLHYVSDQAASRWRLK